MALLSTEGSAPPSEQRIDVRAGRKHGLELVLRLPDAALYLARLSPRLPAQLPTSHRAHVFVTRGAASLATASMRGHRLSPGDAARVLGESDLSLVTETRVEALIWTLPG
jgi:redox-sensitive bicupin YhaK (pirin superfamily)